MAPFNPAVPDKQEPSYLNLSKSISQPEGNKAAAYAGQAAEAGSKSEGIGYQAMGSLAEGVGKIFADSVKGIDTIFKEKIQEEVYSGVDSKRNEFTEFLTTVTGGKIPASLLPPMSGDNVEVSGQSRTTPTPIEDLSTSINGIQMARDNGKLTPTAYIAQIDRVATELRTRYPGYRDYIDKTITQATGMNPANRYIAALLNDINAQQSRSNSEQNKVTTYLKSNAKYPGVDELMTRAENSPGSVTLADAVNHIAPYKKTEYVMATDKARMELNKAGAEETAAKEERNAHVTAQMQAQTIFETLKLGSGTDKLSAKDLAMWTENTMAGKTPMSTQQAEQNTQLFALLEQKAREKLWEKFTTRDADGSSTLSRMGVGGRKKLDEIVNENINNLYGFTRDSLSKNRPDLVAFAGAINKAKFQDIETDVLRDKSVTKIMAMANMINKNMPTMSAPYFIDMIRDGLDVPVRAALAADRMSVLAQPDAREGGPVMTFTKALENTQQRDKGDGTFRPADYKSIVDIVDVLKNPDASEELKGNVIQGAFSPGNRNFLDKFNVDYKDNQGRTVPGKYAVFNQMTSPEITQEMYRLGKKDPDVWRTYLNWAQNSFGNKLFLEELRNLNGMQLDKNVKLIWDADNAQFSTAFVGKPPRYNASPVIDQFTGEKLAQGSPIKSQEDMYAYTKSLNNYQMLKDATTRVNSALVNMSNIAKLDPNMDVNNYLLGRLNAAKFQLGNLQGVPATFFKMVSDINAPSAKNQDKVK